MNNLQKSVLIKKGKRTNVRWLGWLLIEGYDGWNGNKRLR